MAAKAESFGWKGSEMTVDRDIMVLANPEIAGLPNWVIAIVVAGGLAAALSTAAGLLLAIASAVSHDVIKGMINPNISEKGELLASRISMAGAIFLAGLPRSASTGFCRGYRGHRVRSGCRLDLPGADDGHLQQEGEPFRRYLGHDLRYQRHHAVRVPAQGHLLRPGHCDSWVIWARDWFFGISPNAFGAVGAVVNFAVAILVSKVTAEPPEHIQHLVEDIRVPKGAGAATDH